MDLGELAQHHQWAIAKNLCELPQSPFQALRGFEDDERKTGGRGTGNEPQPLTSLSGQETEHEKWAVNQSRSAHRSSERGWTWNRRDPISCGESGGHQIRPGV